MYLYYVMKPELLLSDEFVEFSAKIADLHAKKKQLTAEIKSLIQKHQKEIADITEEAQKLTNEFEEKSAK